ncbi:MAG: hypothetical protein JWP11_1902 [Frankiales bacterium]|nr:hypothetical protein [Frankiales bacterium]
MGAHRLVRRPRQFRGRLGGAVPVGCSCGWATLGPSLVAGLRAHAGHVAEVTGPPSVGVLAARVADLRAQLDAIGVG